MRSPSQPFGMGAIRAKETIAATGQTASDLPGTPIPGATFSSGLLYELLDELPSRRWLMDAVRSVVAEPVGGEA